MKKYYLIPMTEESIYYEGKPLHNILCSTNPELIKRENERINIIYSTSPLIEMPPSEIKRYNKHNKETSEMYDKLLVPQYLIAYGNDHYAKEILTKGKITSEYPAALGIRSVNKEKAENYYYNSNYHNKIINFFKIENNFKFPFFDPYDITAYLEGTIDGVPINGNFSGKIRIKNISKK